MSSFPGVFDRLARLPAAAWCTWLACTFAATCVVIVLVVSLGGTDRIAASAVPFAIGCVALAANNFVWRRSVWGGIALYAVGGLAIAYAIVLTLSVPLRLAIQGTCPLAVSPCPLGFDHPLTSSESIGVYAVTIAGTLALILLFAAVEARHLRPRHTSPLQDKPGA